MRRSILRTALLLAAVGLLAACGNKGPLVLPAGPSGGTVAPAASAPAPAPAASVPLPR